MIFPARQGRENLVSVPDSRNPCFPDFTRRTADSKYKGKTMTAWPDKVIDLIDRAERNATGPIFSGFYIYFPFGHTVLNYRTGDAEMFETYKRHFVKEGQRARKLIEKIDRLRKRYPESIFIVSGDHGPYLSRTAPEEDRRFIVLDRHGVAPGAAERLQSLRTVAGLAGRATVSHTQSHVGRNPCLRRRERAVNRTLHGQRKNSYVSASRSPWCVRRIDNIPRARNRDRLTG